MKTKKSRNQDRIARCKEIVDGATTESLAIIKKADHKDAIANFEAIHVICSKLVLPEGLSTDPDYETIAAYGERLYGPQFIKPQDNPKPLSKDGCNLAKGIFVFRQDALRTGVDGLREGDNPS